MHLASYWGGSFVSNNAYAATIGNGADVKVNWSGTDGGTLEPTGSGYTSTELTFAEQKDLEAVNSDVEQNKKDIAANKADADSKFLTVAEELDKVNEENGRQDASIKGLGEAIKDNSVAIDANKKDIAAVDQASKDRDNLQDQIISKNEFDIKYEEKQREDADKVLQDNIDAETTARKDADKVLQDNIDAEATARVDADRKLDEKFTGEVSRLDNKIDKLDDRVEKVGAMAAAIANLHTMGYDPAAPTEFAVGVGQYRDKTGVALGAFHYPNRDFMLSFSVSSAGDEYMGGIGATWRIGRKSPEKMRQDAAEKAVKARLAKAEADKKAAKDARVAAQQKRHAEMLAARQGK